MSSEMIIVAMLLVAAFFVVAVFIWLLHDKIKYLKMITNSRLTQLQDIDDLQFKRIRQVEAELRALERYLDVQYICPHRCHGKMVKAKGEQE